MKSYECSLPNISYIPKLNSKTGCWLLDQVSIGYVLSDELFVTKVVMPHVGTTASISDNSGHSIADQAFDLALIVGKSSVCFLRGREGHTEDMYPCAHYPTQLPLLADLGSSVRFKFYASHVFFHVMIQGYSTGVVTIHDLAWHLGALIYAPHLMM